MVKKEATEVLDKDFNRRKNNAVTLNKCFSKDNVNVIYDRIFRYGKYDWSDFELYASIHYEEGHRINYHENDKTEIK